MQITKSLIIKYALLDPLQPSWVTTKFIHNKTDIEVEHYHICVNPLSQIFSWSLLLFPRIQIYQNLDILTPNFKESWFGPLLDHCNKNKWLIEK